MDMPSVLSACFDPIRCMCITVLLVLLSACGGGGGSGPTSTSTAVASATSGSGGSASSSSLLSVGGSGVSVSTPVLSLNVALASNMVPLVVDKGPSGASGVINIPYVDVTICQPGTQTCQTIDHVLVDTGSYGLRLVAPGVLDNAFTLPGISTPGGGLLGECAHFADGFTWGSVRVADVRLGGEVASNLPIQLIADPASHFGSVPPACASAGANKSSLAAIGAKGILGVGLYKQDCGSTCVSNALNNQYFTCSTAGVCSGSTVALTSQVTNPVSQFQINNNGVILELPAVPVTGASSVTGTMTFGIETLANNRLGTATVYPTSNGYLTTSYGGKTFSKSFIDSGSNGIFFPDASLSTCTWSSSFFCPASPQSLTAVLQSPSGGTSGAVNFTVVDVSNIFNWAGAAFMGASTTGIFSGTSYFDWGLPFFFNRRVYTAIEGRNAGNRQGPFWAF